MTGPSENPTPLWSQIEAVFHAATVVPPDQREATLRRLCQGDESLLAEVRSLLQSHESSVDFLEAWPNQDADLLQDAFRGWRNAPLGRLDTTGGTEPDHALTEPPNHQEYEPSTGVPQSPNSIPPSPAAAVSLGSPELDDLAEQLVAMRPEFTVQRVVGRGGSGVVLSVFDQRLCRILAVKLLWPKATRQPPRSPAENARQMEREARAAAAVSSEYTVRVYEAGMLPAGTAYLVLEWVAGPSLAQVLQSQGILPAKVAAEVTRQICLGLAAAHRIGVVHSDVKPANVLLQPVDETKQVAATETQATETQVAGTKVAKTQLAEHWKIELDLANWRMKLADFGLASVQHDAPTESAATARENLALLGSNSGSFAGTLAYASPDRVWKRQPLGPADDVWSVGITLYQLLTGTLPFRGPPHAVARALQKPELVRPSILEPSIPKDLESICLKALSTDRSQRYTNGHEMAEDLQRFLTGRPTQARPLPRWQTAYRWAKRHPQLATLSAALLLALSVLTVGALVSRQILAEQNQQLRREQEQAEIARLQRILVASPANLRSLLDSPRLRSESAGPILRAALSQPDLDAQAQLNCQIALAEIGLLTNTDQDNLLAAVTQAPVLLAQCENLLRSLANDRSRAVQALGHQFPNLTQTQSQIRVAIVAAHLGDRRWLEQLATQGPRPQVRTELIHFWPTFYGPLEDMQAWLKGSVSSDLQYTLCLSLALFDPHAFSPQSAAHLLAELDALQVRTDDAGVRAAAGMAARHWRLSLAPTALPIDGTPPDMPAHATGFHLVKIPAGRHRLGRINQDVLHDDHPPHWVTLTRDYWLADREVSRQWYQAFLDDPTYPADKKPLPEHRRPADPATSPTSAHPVQRVSWNDAAMFCNWLSWRQSLQPRYRFTRVELTTDLGAKPANQTPTIERKNPPPPISQEWTVTIDPNADGYRLPSLAEWEAACRAGTESEFFYGDNFDLFRFYGRFSSARIVPTAACGTLLPNRHGLHETLGNVWEWCEDWYQPLGTESLTDPTGPTEPLDGFLGRTFAGGGVQTTSGEPLAGARGYAAVDSRFGNLGFRVARTCQSDSPAEVTSVFVAKASTPTSDADVSK